MRISSIPPSLGNPVILINYCSFSRTENEASLDATLLTNLNIEGGRGYRPGSRPFYAAIKIQRLASFPARKIRPGTHCSHMRTSFRKISVFQYEPPRKLLVLWRLVLEYINLIILRRYYLGVGDLKGRSGWHNWG